MGLPLYRAPVESDIKPKIPKDPPTRARSTIRRTRRSINGSDSSYTPAARFQAYRNGRRASPGAGATWSPWDTIESASGTAPSGSTLRRAAILTDPYPITQSPARQNEPLRPTPQMESALREAVNGHGMSQEMVRFYGEQMAMLHAATSSRPSQAPEEATGSERRDPSPYPLESRSWALPLDRPTPPTQTPPFTPRPVSWRTVDLLARAGESLPPDQAAEVLRRQNEYLNARRRFRALRAARLASTAGDTSQQQSPVDGLGDRDRSLSPEGDGVWDTLLSSITPDPQTPSVGASFASTSAPVSTTSQSTANSAHSSHTHITAPASLDALEDFDFDHPCESGGDNTDTEGDEDDESGEGTLRRFSRSYAALTAHSQARTQRDDDNFEFPGDVESMHRIVRTLARREDIPDEWWAEAGLSRSLPREAA